MPSSAGIFIKISDIISQHEKCGIEIMINPHPPGTALNRPAGNMLVSKKFTRKE
jgi:hypothetical protein